MKGHQDQTKKVEELSIKAQLKMAADSFATD